MGNVTGPRHMNQMTSLNPLAFKPAETAQRESVRYCSKRPKPAVVYIHFCHRYK